MKEMGTNIKIRIIRDTNILFRLVTARKSANVYLRKTLRHMQQLLWITAVFLLSCSASTYDNVDVKRLEEQAARITIVRDTWGIPHVYGKTDADAVFGLMYTQCEENFEKVERAYIEKLGRISEIDGETYLYNDLLSQLLYDTASAIKAYNESPPWLNKLCQAFADGINYYLYKNPEVKPLLLARFEPWYPFLFTDGAYVSMKTENLSGEDIRRMYGWPTSSYLSNYPSEMQGSNAFAIAPGKTEAKKALLYINPHVSFDFRMEAHAVSEEGLNVYGAVTWGQFFVYQGFNEACGWMHTSSLADAVDLYADSILKKEDRFYTTYDGATKPVIQKEMTFHLLKDGSISEHKLIAYLTHHGPVVGKNDKGRLLSLKTLNTPLNSLIQSWQRTKAKSLEDFEKTMKLYSNAATNTMYADKAGNIAYWHGNFIPRRDVQFNWSIPVDGSTSKTAWKGVHKLEEIVQVKNPIQGFIQNCNSNAFNACGLNTINSKDYPGYMMPDQENFRSLFAIKELETETKYTLNKMIALGYSHYLAAFDTLLPPLLSAYDNLPGSDPLKQQLEEPISKLKNWNRESGTTSIATTLAIEWAYYLFNKIPMLGAFAKNQIELVAAAAESKPTILINSLHEIVMNLEKNYGNWRVPWGHINRYQRIAKGEGFNDSKPSLPVGMASSFFGSLPSYEPVWQKTSKGYGTAGNSFVAAVEFGERIKAKAVVPGGQSFDPKSKHYSDQAALYINGKLRDVFFYRGDVEKNKERVYKPGE